MDSVKSLINHLVDQARSLTTKEQLELAMLLIDQARHQSNTQPNTYKWHDFMGIAPCPITGQDAQEWVTHNRSEDEQREIT